MMPRIAAITGTYGTEQENGVGRFIAGLHRWSLDQRHPFKVYSAGDHLHNHPNVHNIHPFGFAIPGGFTAVKAFYPLEGRRRQLGRAIKQFDPHIVHVSTPEVIGITGLGIARKQKRLLAGIYHTDFPAFAHKLVKDSLERLLRERGSTSVAEGPLGSIRTRLLAEYHKRTWGWERMLFGFLTKRFLKRNRKDLNELLYNGVDSIAGAVEGVVCEAMSQFYRPFHLVLARSETYRQKLINEFSLGEDRVRTLRCGVDTNAFCTDRSSADDGLRDKLGIPPHTKVVLYVGRVTDEKNVGFLADAWRHYQAGKPAKSTVFVVVGSGNIEPFRVRAGAGVIATGPRQGAELSAIYRLANVFWTASPHETLGQVVLEALASGVPVIATNTGAAQENVEDGRTGRVLTADDPARWARELNHLLTDDVRLALMSRDAREYAESHTIESSYRHYWTLHEELLDQNNLQRAAASLGTYAFRAFGGVRVDDSPRRQPTLHLSDFHAGKRGCKIPKEAALRVACRRAMERGARCFLHGDFLDTRPPMQKFRAELELVRLIFDEFGVVPEIYLEGNHDYEFGRAKQIENLIGCPVSPSLVHRDDESGLVLTHGHVSEMPEILSIIRNARSSKELARELSLDRLKEALGISALRYDIVGVITNHMEHAGLDGLEEAWRHSFGVRRWLANWLSELPGSKDHCRFGTQALIHMIGSSDREQVLGQICNAMGGWGLIYGHTHEPHVTKQRVVDSQTGQTRTVLLGNSGSFCRKNIPPTWIETDYPHMELWAYKADTDDAEMLDRVSLSPEDDSPYQPVNQVFKSHLQIAEIVETQPSKFHA